MKKRRINSKSLVNSRRIVIKIGSSLIVGESSRRLRSRWLASLSRDISRLRKMGKEIVLVSSGAIALGRDFLSLSKKRLRLDEKQAAAAIGQSRLVNAYQSSLKKFKINIAQVLLTLEDTEKRRRYLNARETIETLIRLSVVPLINENDTVATEEIRFGDNDRLAARVAQMIAADTLVMLSDVEGLYTADPNKDKMARKIDKVYQITPKIYKMAKNTHSDFGSGGMITKIEAAKIALSAGCRMVILFGNKLSPLESIIRSKANEGSWFFIAEIFTDIEIPIDRPASNHCGTCDDCIKVCPTKAIVAPYQLDARRCISYLTIENKDVIPKEMRKAVGNRIFGCDDCQIFCPWNKFAKKLVTDDFLPREQFINESLENLFKWSKDDWEENTKGSAIRRAGYSGWLRNLAVALGNSEKNESVKKTLASRLDDTNEMV